MSHGGGTRISRSRVAPPDPDAVTFTLDLEDHRPHRGIPKRYPEVTRRVLAWLRERGIRGTVFVVGELAREEPGLIREIAGDGHEIALHSYRHRPLAAEDPARFPGRIADAKRRIEDLTGDLLAGFRAPVFSLTRQTLWAADALGDLGFGYSSSVLPAANPLHGFPGAPRHPFRWPGGLLELPVPVARFGPVAIPFLGGFYLRYLPLAVIRRLLRAQAAEAAPWIYCHPYDFDPDERLFRIAGASWTVSFLLWLNRRRTWNKLEGLLADDGTGARSVPLIEQVRGPSFASAPRFEPDPAER